MLPAPAPDASDDPRRRGLLEAAITVFTRFGFRKTSMDEVARAAQVSRQALYLHFENKEELFRAAVNHAIASALAAAVGRLRDTALPLEARLVQAFDDWMGRYVGTLGADAADLAQAASGLLGQLLAEQEARFTEALAKTLSTSRLAAAYKPAGLNARQLAETLQATARGLKHTSGSRDAFVRGVTIAVKALCAPLGARQNPKHDSKQDSKDGGHES